MSAPAIRAKVIDDGHGLRVAIVVPGREQATSHILSVGEAIKLRDELGEAIAAADRAGDYLASDEYRAMVAAVDSDHRQIQRDGEDLLRRLEDRARAIRPDTTKEPRP